MAGPRAPKDPLKKGSSFYICRQKEVAGSPQPNGKGTQFIYLDGGRLLTLARMNGGITDEEMLSNLKTAQGFREMVAGIGVAVEAGPAVQSVGFSFQMYGKTDPNHSGTTIHADCKPDGMEQILWLDGYGWSDDDNVIGQMRFEFEKAEQLATVDVRFYLREGYTAPEQEERHPVDEAGEDYQAILKRSLFGKGNNHRLKGFIERAKNGEPVTMAFIGGSITQGAGAIPITEKSYAYQTYRKFTEHFGCRDNVRFIKAGVGGTSSELGMIRFERDVLREEAMPPDLLVIEYAVNDEGDETKGLCYESLVRKALALSERTAVVLLFAVFADDWNLQERLSPVGVRYGLPMVSIRDGVVEQFYKEYGKGKVMTKSQFFYDSFHPTNLGHQVMADSLLHLMLEADAAPQDAPYSWQEKEPVFGTRFEAVRLLDKRSNTEKASRIEAGSFCETDGILQAVEMDAEYQPVKEFPYNWQHKSGTEPFHMEITCKALLLVSKDSGEISAGCAEAAVDGEKVLTVNPREIGWTHCNAQILFSEEESREHVVEIAMQQGDEDKEFTILGFGYVE